MSNWIKRVLLWGISFLCLWLSIHGIEFRALVPLINAASSYFLFLSILFTAIAIVERAWRWKFFLPLENNIKYSDLLIATSIGQAANYLLPARIGELVRAFTLRQQAGISASTVMATLILERAFDLAMILAGLGIVLTQLAVPRWVQQGGKILLLLDAGFLIALMLLYRYPNMALIIARKLLSPISKKWADRVGHLLTLFIEGLRIFGRRWCLLRAIGWTLILWVTIGLAIFSNLKALNLPATPFNTLTVLSILTLGLAVPSGPGFVGTFEFFTVFALSLLGISNTHAIAFALVFHASQFLITVIMGFVCMWTIGSDKLSINIYRDWMGPFHSSNGIDINDK